MNLFIQSWKIITFGTILCFLFSACSKTETIEEVSPLMCDFVTLNVTNSLADDIIGLEIDGQAIGDIKSGETIDGICFDMVYADFSSSNPMIHITGTYDGQLRDGDIFLCGVGLTTNTTGFFNIEITDYWERGFYYSNL